jgi:hypothetical protein
MSMERDEIIATVCKKREGKADAEAGVHANVSKTTKKADAKRLYEPVSD